VDELPSPGWQAIDDAMARLYGSAVPRHVGYLPPAALSANLQGCSAYAAPGHWHYVTYGLSELYVPDPTDDPQVSGWGFELTFRLLHGVEADPPDWPYSVLNGLANFVNEGNLTIPPPGTRINLGKPITAFPANPDAPQTELTVFAVALDPQLGEIETENGRVSFLLLVGVTDAEKEQMIATSTADVLVALAAGNPLLITDLRRH
jgi:Suppressor of fused protein (SUFU)